MLRLNTASQQLCRETDDVDGWIGQAGTPVFATDGDPDLGRHVVGEPVEGQGRGQTDHAFGHQSGHFGQRLLGIEGRVGKLVEPPCDAHDVACPLHAADRGGRDARRVELRQSRHSPPLQQRQRLAALCGRLGGKHVGKPRIKIKFIRVFISLRGCV